MLWRRSFRIFVTLLEMNLNGLDAMAFGNSLENAVRMLQFEIVCGLDCNWNHCKESKFDAIEYSMRLKNMWVCANKLADELRRFYLLLKLSSSKCRCFCLGLLFSFFLARIFFSYGWSWLVLLEQEQHQIYNCEEWS